MTVCSHCSMSPLKALALGIGGGLTVAGALALGALVSQAISHLVAGVYGSDGGAK